MVRLCDLALCLRTPADFERVRTTLVQFENVGRVLVDGANQQATFVKALQDGQAVNAKHVEAMQAMAADLVQARTEIARLTEALAATRAGA